MSQRNFIVQNVPDVYNRPYMSTYITSPWYENGEYHSGRRYIVDHLRDFGYWEFGSHGENRDEHKAAQRGYFCPEAVFEYLVFHCARDTDDIIIVWHPGLKDGTQQRDGGLTPFNAAEQMKWLNHRRQYQGKPLLSFGEFPFSWAGTDDMWYLRPGADASALHGTVFRRNPTPTQEEVTNYREWFGGSLYAGGVPEEDDGDLTPAQRTSRKNRQSSATPTPPTRTYLEMADRRILAGGPAKYCR